MSNGLEDSSLFDLFRIFAEIETAFLAALHFLAALDAGGEGGPV